MTSTVEFKPARRAIHAVRLVRSCWAAATTASRARRLPAHTTTRHDLEIDIVRGRYRERPAQLWCEYLARGGALAYPEFTSYLRGERDLDSFEQRVLDQTAWELVTFGD